VMRGPLGNIIRSASHDVCVMGPGEPRRPGTRPIEGELLSDSYISPTCCLTRRCYQASSRSSHPAFTPLSRRLS
jgi:hypothetical protein